MHGREAVVADRACVGSAVMVRFKFDMPMSPPVAPTVASDGGN